MGNYKLYLKIKMKFILLAALVNSIDAIRMKSEMPTGQETLCVMRRTGKLDLETTYFSPDFKEHRDGGFNAVALAQVNGDDDKKKARAIAPLDQTSFERIL